MPMLAVGLFFCALIGAETDLGGALLLLICFLATTWVGGARLGHVGMTLLSFGTGALVLGYTYVPYVHRRIEMFLGHLDSDQVAGSLRAMTNGGVLGTGIAQGGARNFGVPYLESDFVFAQVGEELGLFGMLLLVGLLIAFLWQSCAWWSRCATATRRWRASAC
jgi:cell division protein FtsW